jgi:hypothetical protein
MTEIDFLPTERLIKLSTNNTNIVDLTEESIESLNTDYENNKNNNVNIQDNTNDIINKINNLTTADKTNEEDEVIVPLEIKTIDFEPIISVQIDSDWKSKIIDSINVDLIPSKDSILNGQEIINDLINENTKIKTQLNNHKKAIRTINSNFETLKETHDNNIINLNQTIKDLHDRINEIQDVFSDYIDTVNKNLFKHGISQTKKKQATNKVVVYKQ